MSITEEKTSLFLDYLLKLSNENFLAKAASVAIEKEQGKVAEAEQALEKLNAYLQSLQD